MFLAWIPTLVAESTLTTILVAAGTAKLLSPRRFRRTLELIPWVAPWLVRPLSAAIPAFEIAVGLLFLVAPLLASWLSACLFSVFTVPVIWAIITNRKVQCACFGTLSATVLDKRKLWDLCFLIVLASMLAAFGHPINLTKLPTLMLAESFAVTINVSLIYTVGNLISGRYITRRQT